MRDALPTLKPSRPPSHLGTASPQRAAGSGRGEHVPVVARHEDRQCPGPHPPEARGASSSPDASGRPTVIAAATPRARYADSLRLTSGVVAGGGPSQPVIETVAPTWDRSAAMELLEPCVTQIFNWNAISRVASFFIKKPLKTPFFYLI